ncbi:hypothetical protein L6452_38803 [Arctium lappa]|uniref:Uncharacterized protein n=1 Tax=Arctium lappa TaxID=4217 RepID=A0ACB8XRB5_ARCLA|nr:hypothetical protein L6452_38803 [Arctium lappa]
MASLVILSSSLLYPYFTTPLAAGTWSSSNHPSASPPCTCNSSPPTLSSSTTALTSVLPISLPTGICRNDPKDYIFKNECTAHSVEYDVASNSIRPLMVLTDVWCSSGGLMPEDNLVQTGGFNDDDHVVRVFNNSCGSKYCDWVEMQSGLVHRRWSIIAYV